MTDNIAAKTIVITGASSGMGAAAARLLAAKAQMLSSVRVVPTASIHLPPKSSMLVARRLLSLPM